MSDSQYEDMTEQRLRHLVETWRRQQASYPPHVQGRSAAAAVRACADELEEALNECYGDTGAADTGGDADA